MRHEDLVIATITWAKNSEEERLLEECLRSVARLGIPVVITDGGSSDQFIQSLRPLPNVSVFRAERPGVVAQTRASVRASLEFGTEFILYTEPDKRHFFDAILPHFIETAPVADKGLGVAFPSRTPESFATFPATQRCTERVIIDLFAGEVGVDADFCYGPLLMNRTVAPVLESLTEEVGWGWRFHILGAAELAGYRLQPYDAHLPCPLEQRVNDASERMHRIRQLGQNVNGVLSFLQGVEAQLR